MSKVESGREEARRREEEHGFEKRAFGSRKDLSPYIPRALFCLLFCSLWFDLDAVQNHRHHFCCPLKTQIINGCCNGKLADQTACIHLIPVLDSLLFWPSYGLKNWERAGKRGLSWQVIPPQGSSGLRLAFGQPQSKSRSRDQATEEPKVQTYKQPVNELSSACESLLPGSNQNRLLLTELTVLFVLSGRSILIEMVTSHQILNTHNDE